MLRGRGGARSFAQMPEVVDGYRTTSFVAPFTPSLEDIDVVRRILAYKPASSGRFLPNELVLSILSYADYHAILSSERTEEMRAVAIDPPYCCNELYLIGDPVPSPNEGKFLKILEIRFTIQSRDQGWTTEQDICKFPSPVLEGELIFVVPRAWPVIKLLASSCICKLWNRRFDPISRPLFRQCHQFRTSNCS